MPNKRLQITKSMLVRMLADAVMVNLALVGALALRLLLHVANHAANFDAELWEYVIGYGSTGWLLTVTSVTLFAFHGFYTYGRNYQGRYKALVITQAVSQSYLVRSEEHTSELQSR